MKSGLAPTRYAVCSSDASSSASLSKQRRYLDRPRYPGSGRAIRNLPPFVRYCERPGRRLSARPVRLRRSNPLLLKESKSIATRTPTEIPGLRDIVPLGLRVTIDGGDGGDGGLRTRRRASWRGVASYCRAKRRTANCRHDAWSRCRAADSRHDAWSHRPAASRVRLRRFRRHRPLRPLRRFRHPRPPGSRKPLRRKP